MDDMRESSHTIHGIQTLMLVELHYMSLQDIAIITINHQKNTKFSTATKNVQLCHLIPYLYTFKFVLLLVLDNNPLFQKVNKQMKCLKMMINQTNSLLKNIYIPVYCWNYAWKAGVNMSVLKLKNLLKAAQKTNYQILICRYLWVIFH